ncbi:MAG: acyl-ACP--UDP-N-acetylglucosamine O-acyltransferase [Gammaproteobacteria bacterium]|nr:acyl-ACP--UDP-N-acetylglucosamine O-acyltransferase [Gammaproteobacteria bacterium]
MIDPRAVVDPGAELGDVSIGPFSIIGPNVVLEDGVQIGPHVVITGHTTIGPGTRVYQFSSLGEAPQHLGYRGEPTRVRIGARNIIREYCTINRGSGTGLGETAIGNDNFLMAYVHIAHDCVVHDNTIFSNCASLAGHVEVGDHAILGGFTLVHQFCRIGAHSMTGMGTAINRDVPPYVLVAGHSTQPHGINVKGLRRRNFSEEAISDLRSAYRLLYRTGLRLEEALVELENSLPERPEIANFVSFIRGSRRGIMR